MTPGITFDLGPLPVRVEGRHPAVSWSRRVFAPLESGAEPALRFGFSAAPVPMPATDERVGDEKSQVAPGVFGFRQRHFDVRLSREAGAMRVDLHQRDRRPRWLRGLSDPDESLKMWISHGTSIDTHLLKAFAYGIAPFAQQCALLERDAALVHAGAVELDGRAVLLPAWGGGGKSTVTGRAVLHGRARFLADDHAVLGADGTVHLHLLPIHSYLHHAEQDPTVRRRVLASLGAADRVQWRLARGLRPKRVVRWIPPQDLFGADRLARTGRLEQVVVLFRGAGRAFRWEDVEPAVAARPCVGVILEEINDFCDRLALCASGWDAGPLPDVASAAERIRATYETAFATAPHGCARVLVPAEAGADELVAFLAERVPLLREAMG